MMLFENNESISKYDERIIINAPGPIKISDTVILYNNFIYNTVTTEYTIMDFKKEKDNTYIINLKDYININSSNMINQESFIDNNCIFIYKNFEQLTKSDMMLLKINAIISYNNFEQLINIIYWEKDILITFINNKYYYLLLNNIIINDHKPLLDLRIIYDKLNSDKQ
mgnify:CR=1 FL=1